MRVDYYEKTGRQLKYHLLLSLSFCISILGLHSPPIVQPIQPCLLSMIQFPLLPHLKQHPTPVQNQQIIFCEAKFRSTMSKMSKSIFSTLFNLKKTTRILDDKCNLGIFNYLELANHLGLLNNIFIAFKISFYFLTCRVLILIFKYTFNHQGLLLSF